MFRVAGLYAVVAWALIQVADTLAPILGLPDSASRLVLFILVILFPVALILAWAFELTPDGLVADSGQELENPRSGFMTWLLVGLVLLGGGGLYVYNQPETASELRAETSTATLDKSIAVLPFTAFSSDPNEQFFADGLSDTLLHKLAQLSDVRVISRTSSFQYRGEQVDVREVGRELQVATILEGSVQRSGGQLRIIAQLVNTQDGGHIWSQNFDRRSDDIFAIQDEIADAVTRSLQVSLSPEEQAQLVDSGTDSVEAFNRLTLLSESALSLNAFEMSEEAFEERTLEYIREIEQVIALDPEYADAYRVIAELHSSVVFRSRDPFRELDNLNAAYARIQQAMVLQPDDARNLAMYSDLKRREGDSIGAELFAKMAYTLAPNAGGVIANLNLALLDQSKDAPTRLQLSIREEAISPGGQFSNRRRLFALMDLGRSDEAVALLESLKGRVDQPQLLTSDIAYTLAALGRNEEAVSALVEARKGMEDQGGEVLAEAWTSITTSLGISEPESANPQLRTEASAPYNVAKRRFDTGAYNELRNELEQDLLDGIPFSIGRFTLGRVCILIEDYACALNAILQSYPGIESRGPLQPQILGSRGFANALALAFVYSKLGETAAAERLIIAIADYRQERIYDGFFQDGVYNDVEFFLLLGDKAAALDTMRRKIELPGNDVMLQCYFCSFASPVYESLQDDAEFQRLVAEYDRRVAASAAAAQAMIAAAGF